MVSLEDLDLEGAGYVLKQHVWNAARDTMEEWTGHKQAECSLVRTNCAVDCPCSNFASPEIKGT